MQFFRRAIQLEPKINQNAWVLAPTVAKSVGAEAITASLLTQTLNIHKESGVSPRFF